MVTVRIFIDPGVASRPRAFPFAYAPPGERRLCSHSSTPPGFVIFVV
jgi:hypothetical protein